MIIKMYRYNQTIIVPYLNNSINSNNKNNKKNHNNNHNSNNRRSSFLLRLLLVTVLASLLSSITICFNKNYHHNLLFVTAFQNYNYYPNMMISKATMRLFRINISPKQSQRPSSLGLFYSSSSSSLATTSSSSSSWGRYRHHHLQPLSTFSRITTCRYLSSRNDNNNDNNINNNNINNNNNVSSSSSASPSMKMKMMPSSSSLPSPNNATTTMTSTSFSTTSSSSATSIDNINFNNHSTTTMMVNNSHNDMMTTRSISSSSNSDNNDGVDNNSNKNNSTTTNNNYKMEAGTSVLSIDPSIIDIVRLYENNTDKINNIDNTDVNGESTDSSNVNTKKSSMELLLQQLPFVDMFRGSANYIANHRNTVAVYHIPGGIVAGINDSNQNVDKYENDNNSDTVFRDLMNDVALSWLLGMRIVIVAGCRYQIEQRQYKLQNEILKNSNNVGNIDDISHSITNEYTDNELENQHIHNLRITNENALRIVKEEAGYVRFEVERQLARSLRMQGGSSTTVSTGNTKSSSSTTSDMSTTNYNGNGGTIIGGGARIPSTGYDGNVVSGNFYSAQPFGILDGIDYKYTGFVRRVEIEKIKRLHDTRDICLLTSLGVSPSGEVFNVNSESLAAIVAGALSASKVIYFTEQEMELRHIIHGNKIHSLPYRDARNLLQYHHIKINSKGYVTIDNESKFHYKKQQLSSFQNNNNNNSTKEINDKKYQLDMLLKIGWCTEAIALGVKRAHIISPKHGALLQELYTRDGSGTLICADLYEGIRRADYHDVSSIYELIAPLIQKGTLIDRPKSQLEKDIDMYYVYTRDNTIVACGQLKKYENGYAEIGCLVVNSAFRSKGRGDAMLGYLERLCLYNGCQKIFVLSTQTMEWFIERGFKIGRAHV